MVAIGYKKEHYFALLREVAWQHVGSKRVSDNSLIQESSVSQGQTITQLPKKHIIDSVWFWQIRHKLTKLYIAFHVKVIIRTYDVLEKHPPFVFCMCK